MEELNCTDLTQPFQNVRVGVDILSELQEKLKGTVPAEQLPYDVLAAYNYGLRGAQKNLWAYGVHEYEYNRAILKRAQDRRRRKQRRKSSERGICAESRCGEVPDTGADHIRSDEEKERKSCTDRIERCEGEYLERSRNREG